MRCDAHHDGHDCRKPGEWQSYDIIFTAPRFHADGSLKSHAYVTVLQNGVLVQNHYQLQGPTDYITPPRYKSHPLREALSLQFHGNPTRFRNIWIRDLMADAAPATDAAEPEQTETADAPAAKPEKDSAPKAEKDASQDKSKAPAADKAPPAAEETAQEEEDKP